MANLTYLGLMQFWGQNLRVAHVGERIHVYVGHNRVTVELSGVRHLGGLSDSGIVIIDVRSFKTRA